MRHYDDNIANVIYYAQTVYCCVFIWKIKCVLDGVEMYFEITIQNLLGVQTYTSGH